MRRLRFFFSLGYVAALVLCSLLKAPLLGNLRLQLRVNFLRGHHLILRPHARLGAAPYPS